MIAMVFRGELAGGCGDSGPGRPAASVTLVVPQLPGGDRQRNQGADPGPASRRHRVVPDGTGLRSGLARIPGGRRRANALRRDAGVQRRRSRPREDRWRGRSPETHSAATASWYSSGSVFWAKAAKQCPLRIENALAWEQTDAAFDMLVTTEPGKFTAERSGSAVDSCGGRRRTACDACGPLRSAEKDGKQGVDCKQQKMGLTP